MTPPTMLLGRAAHVIIHADVLAASWAHVQGCGRIGVEAEVLWGGVWQRDTATVTLAVAPVGAAVAAGPLAHGLSLGMHAAVTRALETAQCPLIAQVHTHPEAWVGHSGVDDRYPFARDDGFLSVVWPHYAQGRMPGLSAWGIHEIVAGRFHQLSPADIKRRFSVQSGPHSHAGPALLEVTT